MKRTLIALAAATALAGCGGPTTPIANNSAGDDMIGNGMAAGNSGLANVGTMASNTPTDAAGYLARAGAGDSFEIESSKALVAKSKNADAKMFAQMMIDAHTQSTTKVAAAAKTAGLAVPPPVLDASQQQMLDEIKAATPDTVDAVYFGHQSTAHAAALALHRQYARAGDTSSLKKAASEIVPVVEKHIAELEKLGAK